jgi:hypothetical protein
MPHPNIKQPKSEIPIAKPFAALLDQLRDQ